ncbi:ribbon-helix-helix domain-containing protein [Aeoliella sp. ICT_H6.2]|uniref:Ribbon-helix-helix domain-containing protein n=1 Tax=Aeoliella straminimaris TaxID=2954799 RepID=A0A9X2JGC8_9BACT|nr:ribbon-helix-helix domain-containing protein [Aeoliella straminimaris]
MAKKKRPRGRPPQHPEGPTNHIAVRVPAALLAKLEVWAAKAEMNQSEAVTEAIRQLVKGVRPPRTGPRRNNG